MPKADQRSNTWITWAVRAVVWAGLLVGLGACALSHSILTLMATAIVMFGMLFLVRKERRRLTSLAEARSGESICEFARAFDARAVDTWVIRAVYEELQNLLRTSYPSFPLRPSDRLEDLGIDDDDLEMDLALVLSERTGRTLHDADKNPLWGKLSTASDLVMFFNAQALVRYRPMPRAASASG